MRTILIGQAAFAEKVLDGLLANGHEVLALYCPPDRSLGKSDPAKARAVELGIPVRQHPNLKNDEIREEFEELDADLGILAYVTQIVSEPVFSAPRLGSICFHPSLLPRYRGGSAVNWQIIKGEKETGASVFWVDSGIDTGPLIIQKKAHIKAQDSAGSLYYSTLFPLGIDAVLEAVDQIAADQAPKIVQDEAGSSYDPLCRDEHAEIDWRRPTAATIDLIRGCDPQPGAFSKFRDGRLRFYGVSLVEGAGFRPGIVASVSPSGLLIGADNAGILVAKLRFDGAKQGAQEVAGEIGLGPGSRLGLA